MYTSETERKAAAAREIENARKVHAKKYAGSMTRGPQVPDIPFPLFKSSRPRPLGQVLKLEDVERDLKQKYLQKKQ